MNFANHLLSTSSSTKKQGYLHGFLFCIFANLLVCSLALASTANLTWNAPTQNTDGSDLTDLGGYKVYYGTSSSDYSVTIDIGNTTSYSVVGLLDNVTYYFAVTAYNTSNIESDYSNEVSKAASSTTDPSDVDDDGIPNSSDDDDDGDGLSDSEEASLGTDPLVVDSDGDGTNDGQEVTDSSDPLDPGSSLTRLNTTICSEWNGYLGGMLNILEHVNLTSSKKTVQSTLFNQTGEAQSVYNFQLNVNGKFDVLVHDLEGRNQNAYGRVCSTHQGNAGDVDGGMVYYKPSSTTGHYDFAMMFPMSNGKRGRQYIPFNTYQPSLAPQDSPNTVANWLQVTYLGTEAASASGTLIFWGPNGNELAREEITLNSGARRDFSGHRFGPQLVGTVEWIPDNLNTLWLIRNVRYLYDNSSGQDSFDSAFQLEGMFGSGRQLIVPVDTIQRTCVLEVMNTSNSRIKANVQIVGGNGAQLEVTIPANGSRHIVLDDILGPTAIGYAVIQGPTPRSVAAVAMHYGRTSDLGVDYVFAIPAQPALGSVMRGSYNTFLEQDSWLVVVSPTRQNVNVVMTRGDGTQMLDQDFRVSGVTAIRLNNWESPNSYGVATLQPDTNNSIVAWVLRRKGNDFIMPTPVR